MASPMPETVTISAGEYANLLMVQQSADYLHGIISHVAGSGDAPDVVQQFARNLLDEWTK